MADLKTEKSMTIKLDMMPLPGEEIGEEPFTFSDPVFFTDEKTDLNFASDFKVENPVKTLISASFSSGEESGRHEDFCVSSADEIFDLDSMETSPGLPFMLTKFGANNNNVKEIAVSAIVEGEDGVFQVANGLNAGHSLSIDKGFLDLVNSVIDRTS